MQEGIAEGVGDLQCRAQQHGKQEKQRHTPLAKQHQRVQPQHAEPAFRFFDFAGRAIRQRQRIAGQQQ
ncbi:hypothetical protein D3C87_1773190 [compost metagenome]